jgi:glycosyltransferase involved in cell wall biosynthesis
MSSSNDSSVTLSVITCTFNSQKYLSNLIDSVREQTSTPFEHIFIDGGSSDNTLIQIEQYSQAVPYQVKVATDNGTGISNAMNLGASMAQGTHVLFLHSDDYLNSRMSLENLEKDLDPNSDWYVSNCLYVDGEGALLQAAPTIPRYLGDLIRRNHISHPSTVMKTSFLRQLGLFDPSLKLAMDYDLWLKAITVSQPQQSALFLSNFRIHSAGASSSQHLNLAKEALLVRQKHAQKLSDRAFASLVFGFELLTLDHPGLRRHALRLLGRRP